MNVSPKIYTVSEVLRDVKANLETLYPNVWMQGEISNINCHSSGHCYFSLKDPGAQISAVMFADAFRRLKFQPENGLQVVLQGRLTLYPPQGRFQMVAQVMEPQGKGGLQLAFEQLKLKLEKEGLFAPERKKALPEFPRWVGVITSVDGAALHDILTVLKRRAAGLRVLVCPVRVQGEGSASEIANAIALLNRQFPELDAVLLGRGGGSLEDLWSFNEESVARAIAASQLPIVSCVGHETDFTIADFVADLRAPTPSAAAEMICQGRAELEERLAHAFSRLRGSLDSLLERSLARLAHAASSRMLLRPTTLIEEYAQSVDESGRRLRAALDNRLSHWHKDWEHLAQKLHLLSPLATLSRGYAIAWTYPAHLLVKSAAALEPGAQVEVQVQEGRFYAEIQRTDV